MTQMAYRGKEEVPYFFPGHPTSFYVTVAKKLDLDPIWARLLSRSQLSNPSDLPSLK